MTIQTEILEYGIFEILSVEGVELNESQLVEDVVLLAKIFPDAERFISAIERTADELELLVEGRRQGTPLRHNHQGWTSLHYQSIRTNGQRADLRLIYEPNTKPLRIHGFGHRHQPMDFYNRIQLRKEKEPN